MKFIGLWITIALMAAAATTAFAKVDTLHKDYSTVERAKAMHTEKIIILQHPEKMALLRKQYDEQKMAGHHGLGIKNAFYRKAQQLAGTKPDAKTMHTMKTDKLGK